MKVMSRVNPAAHQMMIMKIAATQASMMIRCLKWRKFVTKSIFRRNPNTNTWFNGRITQWKTPLGNRCLTLIRSWIWWKISRKISRASASKKTLQAMLRRKRLLPQHQQIRRTYKHLSPAWIILLAGIITIVAWTLTAIRFYPKDVQ